MSRVRPTIETDAGVEIQCAKCGEFWPADREFFFYSERNGYHSWCKACYREDPKVIAKTQAYIERTAQARATARAAVH